MSASPFEILQRQAETTVRSQVQKETARAARELSLVAQVQQMTGKARRAASDAFDAAGKTRRPPRQAGKLQQERPAGPVVYADGYRRRSPVQPYRRPRDGRLRRRAVRWAAAALLAVLLVLTMWRGGLLHF